MAMEYVAAYYSYLDFMAELSDAECGRLFKACLTYGKFGTAPELRGNERFVWPAIKSQIDRDAEKYDARCEQNKKNRKRMPTGVNHRERPSTTVMDGQPSSTTVTKEKENAKAKEKEKETSPTGEDACMESAVSGVIRDYLDRINPEASPVSIAELRGFAEIMGADVCKRAFDIALDEKKTTWSYIRGILRNRQAQGVTCLADWDALDQRRGEKEHGSSHGEEYANLKSETDGLFGP